MSDKWVVLALDLYLRRCIKSKKGLVIDIINSHGLARAKYKCPLSHHVECVAICVIHDIIINNRKNPCPLHDDTTSNILIELKYKASQTLKQHCSLTWKSCSWFIWCQEPPNSIENISTLNSKMLWRGHLYLNFDFPVIGNRLTWVGNKWR